MVRLPIQDDLEHRLADRPIRWHVERRFRLGIDVRCVHRATHFFVRARSVMRQSAYAEGAVVANVAVVVKNGTFSHSQCVQARRPHLFRFIGHNIPLLAFPLIQQLRRNRFSQRPNTPPMIINAITVGQITLKRSTQALVCERVSFPGTFTDSFRITLFPTARAAQPGSHSLLLRTAFRQAARRVVATRRSGCSAHAARTSYALRGFAPLRRLGRSP